MAGATSSGLGWLGIIRLGLVQTAIGAMAVLTTSTLNRVMVVELALPASVPAALVAWHYVVQLSRPRWGHAADRAAAHGASRTSWIILGLGILAMGAVLAANATVALADAPVLGTILAVLAFTMIGGGVAAAGTSLLALLADAVSDERRPAAAAITWIMMIAGIIVTAGVAGAALDPYSPQRLILVASGVAGVAFILAVLAVRGVEERLPRRDPARRSADVPFTQALALVWRDDRARRFTVFVLVSMLAYSAQDLILEPYAGLVFGYSLGQSTQLTGLQHAGVLSGMALLGLGGTLVKGDRTRLLRACVVLGCLGSAGAMALLAAAGLSPDGVALAPLVVILGLANGVFAVAAIGLMMAFAGEGAGAEGGGRAGLRVGVWGAAQAVGFAVGGFAGATGLDLASQALGPGGHAFALVFGAEAVAFLVAAAIALRLGHGVRTGGYAATPAPAGGGMS